MFLSRNKKNNVYPCKPQFYYIKVGSKGGQNYIGNTCIILVWKRTNLLKTWIPQDISVLNLRSLKDHFLSVYCSHFKTSMVRTSGVPIFKVNTIAYSFTLINNPCEISAKLTLTRSLISPIFVNWHHKIRIQVKPVYNRTPLLANLSFCDHAMTIVRRRASCVVRPSTIYLNDISSSAKEPVSSKLYRTVPHITLYKIS